MSDTLKRDLRDLIDDARAGRDHPESFYTTMECGYTIEEMALDSEVGTS